MKHLVNIRNMDMDMDTIIIICSTQSFEIVGCMKVYIKFLHSLSLYLSIPLFTAAHTVAIERVYYNDSTANVQCVCKKGRRLEQF